MEGIEQRRKEKSPEPDWTALIRNSYLFSQGDTVLQKEIFAWLFNGPLSVASLPDDSWQDGVRKFITAIEKRHHKNVIEGDPGDGIGEDFTDRTDDLESEYKVREARTPEERARAVEESLRRAASSMVNRDMKYAPYGRNFRENKRDTYSSFIIDFGILHKGDGFFTWKGLPPEFQQFWEEVMPHIKQLPQGTHEVYIRDIFKSYLEHHPNLSEEDRAKLQEFLDETSNTTVSAV